MPDFAFPGPGVKVQSVAEGSPAAKAGIAADDVIVSIGGKAVADLKAYSALLKERAPGDVVKVVWRRGEQEMSADVTLGAR
jgi:S1-C subfamily serine protease